MKTVRSFFILSLVFFLFSSYGFAEDEKEVKNVNINTATVEELVGLPGIGNKIANRIIEYREKNGNFKIIEEIMNVKGIGKKKFKKIKGQITVGDETTPIRATPSSTK